MTSVIFPKSVEYTVFCIGHTVHCLFFFFLLSFGQRQVVVSADFRTIQALVELDSINIIKMMMMVLWCN